jgi:hypothetical protein
MPPSHPLPGPGIIRDEMSTLSLPSREVPSTERRSGHMNTVRKQPEAASEETDNRSSGVLEGRARGSSSAEDSMAC